MNIEKTEFSERCEMMECTNAHNKNNQCYGQSFEKFNEKHYCEEHMKKVRMEYDYKHAIKCERIEPKYVKENGKYKRVEGDGKKCNNVATQIKDNKNLCNECFNPLCKNILRYESVPGFRSCKPVVCNKPAKEGEIYCSDCMAE